MRKVFTNGCFDILHSGHVDYLKRSKLLGNHLIVGLNSDASVKRLKGPSRPINNQEDRKFVLENLSCVDEVIIFDEDTPYELIQSIRPNIITKGGDYKIQDVVGHDIVQYTYIIPYKKGYSTTDIIERINDET
jgi:D-beta-D-heptose 7-phosphate kinase/D-beta-D-heptose 1-phosphate adenosyltransferase